MTTSLSRLASGADSTAETRAVRGRRRGPAAWVGVVPKAEGQQLL